MLLEAAQRSVWQTSSGALRDIHGTLGACHVTPRLFPLPYSRSFNITTACTRPFTLTPMHFSCSRLFPPPCSMVSVHAFGWVGPRPRYDLVTATSQDPLALTRSSALPARLSVYPAIWKRWPLFLTPAKCVRYSFIMKICSICGPALEATSTTVSNRCRV